MYLYTFVSAILPRPGFHLSQRHPNCCGSTWLKNSARIARRPKIQKAGVSKESLLREIAGIIGQFKVLAEEFRKVIK